MTLQRDCNSKDDLHHHHYEKNAIENINRLIANYSREERVDQGHDARTEYHDCQNDEDNSDKRQDDATVALMTLHSAKGLEFSDVFLVGLEEGILPHARSIEAASDVDGAAAGDPLAEERRLLYVGITRARKRLTLSLCKQRGRNPQPTVPSRYLQAIPEELLEVKAADAQRTPEESQELRSSFFAQMKEMLEKPE